MASQLFIFNEALGHLGERRLASASENREPRRVLDSYWSEVVAYCLGEGLWRFAKRVTQIDASTTMIPAFGMTNAFKKPTDWVKTFVLSTSPQMDPPLLQYTDEAGFWYANFTPIYAAYVSNDPTYGMNMGLWPSRFTDFVAFRLARYSAFRITGSKDLAESLVKKEDRARRIAKAEEALNDPPGLPPTPFWVRARRGGFGPGGLFIGGGTGSN